MPTETKGLQFLVRALGSRNFRLFFFGQAVSLIGTWMQLIAMRWRRCSVRWYCARDDQKRGRVLSLFVMARRGIESLGSLVFGAVAGGLGTPTTLMIGGAVCLLSRRRLLPPNFPPYGKPAAPSIAIGKPSPQEGP
ncbi:MAG TPA: hypothetical protein VGB09_11810 [Candidatus Binatia bacterium]